VTAAVSITLLLIGSAIGARAQERPAFKSGVTLVTVDVTVLDRDGQPVPDLTAADFDVQQDGRTQPVRSVTYLRAAGRWAARSGPRSAPAPHRRALPDRRH
jgi:hypothetical protein